MRWWNTRITATSRASTASSYAWNKGGAWCNNVTTCLSRRDTRLGSSKKMDKKLSFSRFFSNGQKFNPDFYYWNRIKIRYCDGSSFTGDVEAVDPATNLHFRGARIFVAVNEDLLAKGMKNAKNAILSGCSSGALASIIHCDRFKTLLPAAAKVKCLSDAGYFINTKTVSGTQHIEQLYSQVVKTHGSAKYLPPSCTSRLSPGLIKNILALGVADPHGNWRHCKLDMNNCSPNQLTVMQDFRTEFLKAISMLGNSPSKGMFIDACYAHCQTGMQETWMRSDSPVLANTCADNSEGCGRLVL